MTGILIRVLKIIDGKGSTKKRFKYIRGNYGRWHRKPILAIEQGELSQTIS